MGDEAFAEHLTHVLWDLQNQIRVNAARSLSTIPIAGFRQKHKRQLHRRELAMKVLVAERCGFCLGVKNAIAMAETALKTNKHIYSLGPVIHNDQVVEKLAQEGLQTVKSMEEIPSGTVLIRSHGATLAQLEEIKQKGLEIIDATCVLVKRVQKIAAAAQPRRL